MEKMIKKNNSYFRQPNNKGTAYLWQLLLQHFTYAEENHKFASRQIPA